MNHSVRPPSVPRRRWPLALTAFVVLALAPAAAHASVAGEQSQGAGLLGQVDRGTLKCASVSNDQFDAIGEYVMRRMLGSTAAHIQMNTVMSGMMGTRGEQQMHVVMGRRFAGCGDGRMGAAYAGLMGAMGGSGANGSGSAAVGRGMMGSNAANRSSFGMMGGTSASSTGHDNGWDTATTVVVVLLGILIVLAGAALWRQRNARPDSGAPAGGGTP